MIIEIAKGTEARLWASAVDRHNWNANLAKSFSRLARMLSTRGLFAGFTGATEATLRVSFERKWSKWCFTEAIIAWWSLQQML